MELLDLGLDALLLDLLFDPIPEPLSSIQHAAITDYSPILDSYRFPLLLLLSPTLMNSLVIQILKTTSTRPMDRKSLTVTLPTTFLIDLMTHIRMLTTTLEVL